LTREREGRRNHYRINAQQPLRHPLEQPHTVGELIEAVSGHVLDQAVALPSKNIRHDR
jgi:hypothetical protein